MPRPTLSLVVAMLSVASLGAPTAAQPLSPSPEPAGPWPVPSHLEVPEAGVAVTFPAGLDATILMDRVMLELPPGVTAPDAASRWNVASAFATDGTGCLLTMYEGHPLMFEEHAEWIELGVTDAPGFAGTVASTAVQLPAGDAVRLDVADQASAAYATAYLIAGHGSARYLLTCTATEPTGDHWLAVAESIELMPIAAEPSAPADQDGRASSQDLSIVRGYSTVVAVVDPSTPGFPEGSLMNADCQFALWLPAEDGSAQEWSACTLSDEPVEPPEQQGPRPSATLVTTGGPCQWRSDYWYESSRRQVEADAFQTVITPDGRVFVWSGYPAEPLDCLGG